MEHLVRISNDYDKKKDMEIMLHIQTVPYIVRNCYTNKSEGYFDNLRSSPYEQPSSLLLRWNPTPGMLRVPSFFQQNFCIFSARWVSILKKNSVFVEQDGTHLQEIFCILFHKVAAFYT